jgi:hypothetical protein
MENAASASSNSNQLADVTKQRILDYENQLMRKCDQGEGWTAKDFQICNYCIHMRKKYNWHDSAGTEAVNSGITEDNKGQRMVVDDGGAFLSGVGPGGRVFRAMKRSPAPESIIDHKQTLERKQAIINMNNYYHNELYAKGVR